MAITNEKIIQRYLDFLHEYEEFYLAKGMGDSETAKRKLENAGEKLSQVIEFAIKRHLRGQVDEHFCLPGIIKRYYYDWEAISVKDKSEKANTIGGVKSIVDFEFIATHRDEVSNNSKHRAIDIYESDIKMYASKVRAFLKQYIDSDYHWFGLEEYLKFPHTDINTLYEKLNKFDYEDCHYILLVPKFGFDTKALAPFANVNWTLVINFDNTSDKDGFSKNVYDNRYSQIIKTRDEYDIANLSVMSKTPICYYANGYSSVPSAATKKEWNRNYYSHLNTFIENLYSVSPSQKAIVVSLLDNEEYLSYIVEILRRYFDNCDFVSIDFSHQNDKDFCDKLNVTYLNITIDDVCQCFTMYLRPSDIVGKQFYLLPHLDKKEEQGEKGIDDLRLLTLMQYFDVLYDGIEKDCPAADKLAFNLGDRPLQWSDIVNRYDARMSKFDRLYLKPLRTFIEKRIKEVQIVHQPGYGGTTVARQLAWDLHSEYPVLVMTKYAPDAVQMIEDLYKLLKLPIVIFVEVPQIATKDECKRMTKSINPTIPATFIYVVRQMFHFGNISSVLSVEHWGNDTGILVNHFSEDLQNFEKEERERRKIALEDMMGDDAEPFEQTPFYAGLVTYEDQFVAVDSFLKNFEDVINDNRLLKTVIIDLCLFDIYSARSLPALFLAIIYGQEVNGRVFKLENHIDQATGVVKTLLKKEIVGNTVYWRLKRSFFSKKLLGELTQNNESVLTDYCVQLIEDMSLLPELEMAENYVKDLFIQTHEDREGEFSSIISSMKDSSNKLRIFQAIVHRFPTNPHFHSHLARFYSKEQHNFTEAIKCADIALDLNETDPLLYHIKGSIYKLQIEEIASSCIKHNPDIKQTIALIKELSDESAYCFSRTRELSGDYFELDSYGYVSHIQMRVLCIDLISRLLNSSKAELLTREPYIDWLDEIQSLWEEIKRSLDEEDRFSVECSNKILSLYDDYGKILQNLQNLAERDSSSRSIANRQIAHVLFLCIDKGYRKPDETNRILELMSSNIDLEPSEEKNYILWFRAARMLNTSLDDTLSKITSWNGVHPFIDLSFYIYTLHVAKAVIEHNSFSAQKALEYMSECHRCGCGDVRVREWLANGSDLDCIVKNSKNIDRSNFRYVRGTIDNYINDGSATIIIEDTDLKVFFNPQKSHITRSDMNRRVQFYLGFSYDGLRADEESLTIVL